MLNLIEIIKTIILGNYQKALLNGYQLVVLVI